MSNQSASAKESTQFSVKLYCEEEQRCKEELINPSKRFSSHRFSSHSELCEAEFDSVINYPKPRPIGLDTLNKLKARLSVEGSQGEEVTNTAVGRVAVRIPDLQELNP